MAPFPGTTGIGNANSRACGSACTWWKFWPFGGCCTEE